MSDLRPIGEPVTIDGEERYLLFTLNAIDELQSEMDMPINEVIQLLMDDRRSYGILKLILTVLLNDESARAKYREEKELRQYTQQEVGWAVSRLNEVKITTAVLKAYGLSVPEPDEFDTPKNGKGGQQK